MNIDAIMGLLGGLLISSLSIYLKDRISKRDKPERYQDKIYDQKLLAYKSLASKLVQFRHSFFTFFIDKEATAQAIFDSRQALLDCIFENVIFLSDDLNRELGRLLSFEQPKRGQVDKKKFMEYFEVSAEVMTLMKKELGFYTIHSKFQDVFPEISMTEINRFKEEDTRNET